MRPSISAWKPALNSAIQAESHGRATYPEEARAPASSCSLRVAQVVDKRQEVGMTFYGLQRQRQGAVMVVDAPEIWSVEKSVLYGMQGLAHVQASH